MQEPFKRSASPKSFYWWAYGVALLLCCATAVSFFADQLWLIPAMLTVALTAVAVFAVTYPIVMLAMGAPMFVLVSAAVGLTTLFRCIQRWIKDGNCWVRRV